MSSRTLFQAFASVWQAGNDDQRVKILIEGSVWSSKNDAIESIDNILSSLENGSPAIETLEAARAALEGMKQ